MAVNGCQCDPGMTKLATDARNVFLCSSCEELRCSRCRPTKRDCCGNAKLIRSPVMLSAVPGKTPPLSCSRGCVGGPRHYACKRARKEGIAVGGGLVVAISGGGIKVVEAVVDKAILVTALATIDDGSRIPVHFMAMPPIIPGIALKAFPALAGLEAIDAPVLLKMVSAPQGYPMRPFLGLHKELWKACLDNPCSRARFSCISGVRRVPSGIVLPHILRKSVPQLPPVCTRIGSMSVRCEYCQKNFISEKNYVGSCVPDHDSEASTF